MKDVGAKPDSLRSARATATILVPAHCIPMLESGETGKGDPLATARVAGILAAKRTDEILPLCHPLPLQHAEVHYELGADRVVITTEVQTIAPTGVEMEALTAASVTALCLYDMLKPYVDQSELAITDTRLLEKTGGKSHFPRRLPAPRAAAVLDLAGIGDVVVEAMEAGGFDPVDAHFCDGRATLAQAVMDAHDAGCACIVVAGGTAATDHALNALRPLISAEMPGLMETVRAYGQRRRPVAMLESGIAGMVGDSLLFTVPGEAEAAEGALTALMPGLIQFFATR